MQAFSRSKGIPGVRYQFICGVPVAMNPPMSFHRAIVANAFTDGESVPSDVLQSSVALADLYENTGL